MLQFKPYTRQARQVGLLLIAATLMLAYGTSLSAHGPKGHTEGFTALAAVKKGTMLYDKLVTSGKLDESWETGLESIRVYKRDAGQDETVVKFTRKLGDPGSVYIFFNKKGEYVGSNFSGK